MKKYQTWAYLNAEGKATWGDIFPEGEVPIQSIIAQSATLDGVDRTERIYIIDWKELTTQQQDAILIKISKLRCAAKDGILKEVLRVGLPLRENYTEGTGTSRLELFI